MGSTDATASQIQLLRQAMLVNYSLGQQLDAVGNNRGVPRPEDTDNDDLYRGVIKALAWLPKHVLLSYYALLGAVFGTQEVVKAAYGRPWKIYEVNPNEVIIELPYALVSGNTEVSAYLHGASGTARVTSGPTNTFTVDHDISLASATSIVGFAILVNTAVNVWTTYTIVSYSFSAGTGTVVVSASTLPTGGGKFYLVVPGDNIVSYRGKYVATGGFVSTYITKGFGNTGTLYVTGDASSDAIPGMTVSLQIGSAFSNRVVSTSTYSNTTNQTTVVLTTTDVPSNGGVPDSFIVLQELADQATTPPHNDRIYLTGTALYQVVQFYLDLLVRAAGIVVRLELV